MNDDTRLRDGLGPRASPPGSAAAGEGAQAELASGSSVYAALDLGTNNCRLLIACPTGDNFRVIDSFSRIIRLGEGVSATGCISEAALDLPRQDGGEAGEPPAPDRDRSLPRRLECRWFPRSRRGRDRHPPGGDR